MSTTHKSDQALEAWYESQTEETLRDLQDRFDADTPRKAWEAFSNDCPPPAQQSPSDSLAAPAEAGQEVCSTAFSDGDYSVSSVDHLDACCTACAWTGPLWRAECFCHTPPAVVIGCPLCAGALVLAV